MTALTEYRDAVAAAEAAEVAARDVVETWTDRVTTLTTEAEQLTNSLGDVALADLDAASALQAHIATTEAGAAAASAALRVAERELEAAAARVPAARHEVLREEARELWAKAGAHQATTDRLVTELREHEGVTFVPFTVNGGLATPAQTTTSTLVEQATSKDAEAAQLLAPLRGETVQVRPGPIRAGGMQDVVIAGQVAGVLQGESRYFSVLVDGEPLRTDAGRLVTITVGWSDPKFSRTVQVPFGSTVEVCGDIATSSLVIDG